MQLRILYFLLYFTSLHLLYFCRAASVTVSVLLSFTRASTQGIGAALRVVPNCTPSTKASTQGTGAALRASGAQVHTFMFSTLPLSISANPGEESASSGVVDISESIVPVLVLSAAAAAAATTDCYASPQS